MSKPGEVLISHVYIEQCYSHHSFVFLHYSITSFPGHFESMVKKLEEANDKGWGQQRFGRLWWS